MVFDQVSGKVEPFPELESESEEEEQAMGQQEVCAFNPEADMDVCCAAMAAGPVTVFTAGIVVGYVVAVFLRRL